MPEEDQQLLAQLRAIGNRVQDIRRWADLSQDELAALMGVERRTVQKVERGETDARLSWLIGISTAVHVPLHVLVDLSDDAWQPPPAAKPRRWFRRPPGT